MNENHKTKYDRAEIASKLEKLEELIADDPALNQYQLAEKLEVPRTTLRHWLKRREQIDANPQIVDFLESSVGLAFLHRLVIGSVFTLTMMGIGSSRTVALLLELTGLDRFVASSVGSLHYFTVEMEQAIVDFGNLEQERLATEMPPKEITVCQDETFHPEICLVSVEPASNYILLEKYTKDRKATTWDKAMEGALKQLPVKVIQSTSDEGVAICCHVKNTLQAHHSPDLFHIQQELVKATGPALRRQLKAAQKAEDDAKKQFALVNPTAHLEEDENLTSQISREQEALAREAGEREASGERKPLLPQEQQEQYVETESLKDDEIQSIVRAEQRQNRETQLASEIERTSLNQSVLKADLNSDTDDYALDESQPAVASEASATSTEAIRVQVSSTDKQAQPNAHALLSAATEARQIAEERISTATAAVKKINQLYHPYDLASGVAIDPKAIEGALETEMGKIEKMAQEADLSDSAHKRIKKAQRMISLMIATLTFFFLTITAKVKGLMLGQEVEEVMLSQLIPAIYLDLVSKKTSDPVERKQLQQVSSQLLAQVNARDGPLSNLSQQELERLEKVAVECAQLFQRSSSCVEGRNGRLALWHHSLHRLSDRKLAALTTVHNYFVKRPDGTTAAERFFGQKPSELFPWLLERLSLLARPAQKRPRTAPAPYLAKAAQSPQS